jgi:hypothetical protein
VLRLAGLLLALLTVEVQYVESNYLDAAPAEAGSPAAEGPDAKSGGEEKSVGDQATYEKWIAWATIALTLATLGLMGFTAALWWQTRRLARDAATTASKQRRDTLRSLKISRQIAKSSAQSSAAAMLSVEVARESLRHIERAFLSVGNFAVQSVHQNANVSAFTYTVHNSGRTPAHVTARFVVQAALDQLPSSPTYASAEPPLAGGSIAPGQANVFTIESIPRLSSAEVDAVTSGAKKYWIWGYVDYDDAFGQQHRTAFCVMQKHMNSSVLLVDGGDAYNYAT